jgi:hypothetical protein
MALKALPLVKQVKRLGYSLLEKRKHWQGNKPVWLIYMARKALQLVVKASN